MSFSHQELIIELTDQVTFCVSSKAFVNMQCVGSREIFRLNKSIHLCHPEKQMGQSKDE